jgi:predicted amidohydrolase YtcJ
MASLGVSLEELDLRGVASLKEVTYRVAEAARKPGRSGWILGRNWDQSLWPGGEFPDTAALDAGSPERPVWLRRVDGHAGWANRAAMKAAGIDRSSKAPADGQIILDKDGEPTGILIDGAMGLVDRVVPGESKEDIERQILLAQSLVLSEGLVAIHDAGISTTETEVYRALAADGRLKVRIYAMANPPAGREIEFVSQPPEATIATDRFRLRAIKLFMDGAMGSRGALMAEPYSDDPHNHGLYLIEAVHLQAITEQALRSGWQVCTHAIGDKGNSLVLDAYLGALESVPEAADPRLRIEHAQVVRHTDIQRFSRGRIIASMQPAHAGTDQRWADIRLGPDRVLGAYAWRWFAEGQVPLAFGSDFPVEIVDPLWGLYSGATRRDLDHGPVGGWHAEQVLTLHELLRGFTAGAAYAGFAETAMGILKPGMRADLTVFDRDLFEVNPDDWMKAEVEATLVDGEVVHQAD